MVKWNGNGFNSKISHHEAKELSEIVMKRITYVPKELGADWRDIPNKPVNLSNGRVTPKLKYPYISAKTGKPAGIVSLSLFKVEKILQGSPDSIPSPSCLVQIQIMGGKLCLRSKGKTLLGFVNKLLKTKRLLTTPINVLPLHLSRP